MYQIVEFGLHLFNDTRPSGHISRPTKLLRLNNITRGSPTNNHIMAVNINRFDPQNVMQVIEIFVSLINSLWPSDAIWQHRFGSTLIQVMACCRMVPSHYLTNVDVSSIRFGDIHLRAILQKVSQPPIIKISLKITYLKFHSNLPGVNELTHYGQVTSCSVIDLGYLFFFSGNGLWQLVTHSMYSVLRHYLNQWCFFVNWTQTNLREISINITKLSFKKMYLKMSAQCKSLCSDFNVLKM